MEDFFDLRSQERGSDSDVELYASKGKKKATKVVMKNLPQKKANQMLFNGLANCDKLMLRNSPFVVARPEISEKMQLPKISSMYLSTMLTLTKSSDTPLRTLVRKGIDRSHLPKRKFQRISG